jgi:sulfur carrier protein
MKMKIRVKYRGKYRDINIDKNNIKAIDILKALDLSPQFAFVVKNGEVAPEDEPISEKDDIKVVNAISGGKN